MSGGGESEVVSKGRRCWMGFISFLMGRLRINWGFGSGVDENGGCELFLCVLFSTQFLSWKGKCVI